MLAQFSHPNVILVAEIFESEDSYYSVMEFCEGGELFNYIVKKNRLSEDESAFFFFQLINGLEYIHSLGIVHRDLKPENLLLTSDHILKIIDFGLSNYFKTGQKNLLSTPCGSPCYASPEMVAGKKYDGFKIDVWSCGIILYAMLCGYLPFEDPDNEVLFKKILECKLDFPGYVNKLSIDLIEKILVTDPEKRITIPEIKRHPFYLKGKDIFEEGFSINQIMQNPIEKNMSEKNSEMRDNNAINNNEENKKEKTIEKI
jgi:5'-AMP-activated protein kinase catalytic alpha subunit